jgi:hypothetical protein
MNLHEFLAKCTTEGEGKNDIARRLRSWLGAAKNTDVGLTTCKTIIEELVASKKLKMNTESLYLKGENA